MEAPTLANFYDLTQDEAPVAQLPEVLNLVSSSSDEEEPIARRVKQRTGRQQVSHFEGAYQDLATQQRLADEEKARLAGTVEIRDAGAMGDGLFALRDLQPGELQLSYYGKHYAGESRYLDDYPDDDGVNTMALRGEYFDGTPIDSLARRINHRVPGNMEFVEDESSTYVQLELIAPVRAGEQLFVDYGSSYAYSKHGFARFTGGGVLDDINPFHKTTIADAIDRQKAINDHPYSIRRLL